MVLGLLGETGFYALYGLILAGWDGWIGWDGGGTGVGQGWDGSGMEGLTLAGAGTGAPPLALEGWRAMVSGGWHQLRWCCKGAECLCQSNKIIKIDCT